MIKKKLPFILFFLILKICLAQENDLYSGGWATTTKDIVNSNNQYHNIQSITTTPFKENKLIIFSSTTREDSVIKAFQILQDNLTWGPVLWEGGEGVVEATEIEIKQLDDRNQNDKNIYRGKWSEINIKHSEDFYKTNWIAFNNSSPIKLRTMIAFFKQEREFVLSVNQATIGCNEGYIVVYVNGQAIKENRQGTVAAKRFYSGASIYGIGTRISIESFTSCSKTKGVSGSFKFKI